MEKRTYHEVESHYTDKLNIIREEIIDSIKSALEWLGGKVCLGYYHNERNLDRYTFFEGPERDRLAILKTTDSPKTEPV